MNAPFRHVPALDGIRGVAIVWVVLHNTTFLVSGPTRGVLYLLNVFAHTGWIGVQLFFALSGLLITAGLIETQGTAHYFRNFYARRALRILPLYYSALCLVFLILPHLATLPAAFTSAGQAPLWLFLTNWTTRVPYGFSHFWSLAVEEQFYLVWPLLVFRLAPRRLLPACLAIAAAALLVRIFLSVRGADPWTIYSNTVCRMDALALGGAGACVLFMPAQRAWLARHRGVVGLATALVFIAGVPLTHVYSTTGYAGQTLGYLLLAICSAVLVTALAGAGERPFARPWSVLVAVLAWGPLRSCGKFSYAMYVLHNLLHKLFGEPWLLARFGPHPPASVIFTYALGILVASYVLAFVSYELLEKRFLRLKSRFGPRPALA